MTNTRTDPAALLPPPHAPHPSIVADDTSDAKTARTRSWPLVSVIVPVRNEAAFITAMLRQLLTQDYPTDRFEVIVADGESSDDTPSLVRELQLRHRNLQLVSNSGRWSSAGRNAAIEASRGEYIVLVDGHCELRNTRYLKDIAEAFERSGADSIGRPQPLDVSHATPIQRTIAAARASRLGHHPESFIYSAAERFVRPDSVAIAYRREVFTRIGTFDERFDACEDVEFNHRLGQAGMTCYFTPQVAVHYHPRGTLRGLFRQMVRYGRGRVRLLRKHHDSFTLACFLPAFFVLGLIVGPVLACLTSWLAIVFFASLGLYAAGLLAGSAAVALENRDLRALFLAPLVFVSIHVGAGAGILLEALRPGRPPVRIARPAMDIPQRRAA